MSYYDYGLGQTQSPVWPNMAMQPVPQMVQPIQASEDKLVWVRGGEKAVQSYPQAPGRTGYYTDFDEPILVKKVTNNNGQIADLKVFDLVERQTQVQPVTQPENNYVSKKDFNDYSENINNTLIQLMEKIDRLDQPKQQYNKPYRKGGVNNNA